MMKITELILLCAVWTIVVLAAFNMRKISRFFQSGNSSIMNQTPDHLLNEDMDMLVRPIPVIRMVFNDGDINPKILADFTVKYSDLVSGNYTLPTMNAPEILTGKKEELLSANQIDISELEDINSIYSPGGSNSNNENKS